MEHVHSEHVAASPDRVFAALAVPENLAQFVPQLTSIRQRDGERVEVEARYEGRTQHGEAYFRADEDERKVEWGSGGGYRGWMQVVADDGVGGADPSQGSGLRGLADRVEALGGRLTLDSPAGGGTRLRAEIPHGLPQPVAAAGGDPVAGATI